MKTQVDAQALPQILPNPHVDFRGSERDAGHDAAFTMTGTQAVMLLVG